MPDRYEVDAARYEEVLGREIDGLSGTVAVDRRGYSEAVADELGDDYLFGEALLFDQEQQDADLAESGLACYASLLRNVYDDGIADHVEPGLPLVLEAEPRYDEVWMQVGDHGTGEDLLGMKAKRLAVRESMDDALYDTDSLEALVEEVEPFRERFGDLWRVDIPTRLGLTDRDDVGEHQLQIWLTDADPLPSERQHYMEEASDRYDIPLERLTHDVEPVSGKRSHVRVLEQRPAAKESVDAVFDAMRYLRGFDDLPHRDRLALLDRTLDADEPERDRLQEFGTIVAGLDQDVRDRLVETLAGTDAEAGEILYEVATGRDTTYAIAIDEVEEITGLFFPERVEDEDAGTLFDNTLSYWEREQALETYSLDWNSPYRELAEELNEEYAEEMKELARIADAAGRGGRDFEPFDLQERLDQLDRLHADGDRINRQELVEQFERELAERKQDCLVEALEHPGRRRLLHRYRKITGDTEPAATERRATAYVVREDKNYHAVRRMLDPSQDVYRDSGFDRNTDWLEEHGFELDDLTGFTFEKDGVEIGVAEPLTSYEVQHEINGFEPGTEREERAVMNAADVNKQVLYAENDGELLGAALTGVTEDDRLVADGPYAVGHDEAVKAILDDAVDAYADRLDADTVLSGGKVRGITSISFRRTFRMP